MSKWSKNSKGKADAMGGYYYPQGRKGKFWPRDVIKRPHVKYIYGRTKK